MRILTITANLLPTEITDARRAHKLRWIVAALLVVVVAGLGYWDFHARQATSDAQSTLTKTQANVQSLKQQQQKYGELSNVKNANAAINSKLTQLMGKDLAWYDLLPAVRNAANTSVVAVTNISASMSTASAAAAAPATAGSSAVEVGSISVVGTAPDKTKIATFLDTLAKVPGFGTPTLTSVAAQGNLFQFTLTVPFTSALYQGRYTPTTGGK